MECDFKSWTEIISAISSSIAACLSLWFNYYYFKINITAKCISKKDFEFKDGYYYTNLVHLEISNTCRRVVTITDIKIKIMNYESSLDYSNFDQHSNSLPYKLNPGEICNIYFSDDNLINILENIAKDSPKLTNKLLSFVVIDNFGNRINVKTNLTIEKVLNQNNS